MKIMQYVRHSLLLAIGSSYDTVWRDLNAKLEEEDCNLLQSLILISLFFEESETVTPSGLAAIFRTTRGNISHCVTRLEKLEFLKRSLDEKDARSYRLRLMPKGRKAAIRLMKTIDALENHFESELGKQTVQTTIASMAAIEAVYRARRVPGALGRPGNARPA